MRWAELSALIGTPLPYKCREEAVHGPQMHHGTEVMLEEEPCEQCGQWRVQNLGGIFRVPA